jgi:glycosyltransferase involved in cell wall biosynthesis
LNKKDKVAIVFAEGSALYGTERAALALKQYYNAVEFQFYSIFQKLDSRVSGYDGGTSFRIIGLFVKLFIKSKFKYIISCNHHFSSIACIISVITKRKVICWEHSENGFAKTYLKLIKKIAYRFADKIVVVNSSDYQYWKKVNSQTFLIPNFLFLKEESEYIAQPIEQKSIDILYCGRASFERGFDILPKIFLELSKLSQEKLNICLIGSGFQTLISLSNEKIQIKIIDYVNNIAPYLSKSCVYINPARSESFGLSMYQARAMGVPVVSWSHTSAAKDLQGQQGVYLVQNYDFRDFALTLLNAMHLESLNNTFSQEIDKIIELWNKVLK